MIPYRGCEGAIGRVSNVYPGDPPVVDVDTEGEGCTRGEGVTVLQGAPQLGVAAHGHVTWGSVCHLPNKHLRRERWIWCERRTSSNTTVW